MSQINAELIGIDELRKAVKRNPRIVLLEAKKFLQRGMALYRSGIQNRPWQIGGTGGGAPVATRNLVQSHAVRYHGDLSASIGPGRTHPVKYAHFVHGGTRMMQARPWLDYVKNQYEPQIINLTKELLRNIVQDLAK